MADPAASVTIEDHGTIRLIRIEREARSNALDAAVARLHRRYLALATARPKT